MTTTAAQQVALDNALVPLEKRVKIGKMTNQQMRDSTAYKTYFAYATGAASPKMKRKFKKPTSLSKKRALVTIEEEEPKPAKKVKMAPATTERNKGIDLLFEAALLEEAQEVTDEPKGKSVNIHEGTGLKPGVPDVSTFESSISENESWGDSRDESNEQEEETQDDEYVHTLEDYVPTDDETNDESNDVDEEEYDRIDKELYAYVNVRLTDAEPTDEEKGDEEITDSEHVDAECVRNYGLLQLSTSDSI
ncbi:hypothetical protein Tco_0935853 [Tanacetum coccineum]